MTRLEYRRSLGLPEGSQFTTKGMPIAKPKGKSKFGAKKTVVDGFTFDSKAEAKRYGELKALERGKQISYLIIHPKFPVVINGVEVFVWKADFQYLDRTPTMLRGELATTVVEDVKSEGTRREREWKLKKRVVEAACGITITEVIR
jgi:hypothetical protein